MIKRPVLCLIALCFCIPFVVVAEDQNLSELTGIIHRGDVKCPEPCLEIDGIFRPDNSYGIISLRGDMLKDIPDGTRVWVKGVIGTELLNSRKQESPVQGFTTWKIFMVVKECRKIAKAFEKPKEKSLQN